MGELQKRLENLIPPRRVRSRGYVIRLGSSPNPKVKNDLQTSFRPAGLELQNDLETSFRPAGLEIQKRLANLVPPRRVGKPRLGNAVRFVSKPESQERLANLVLPRRVRNPKTTCKPRSAPQGWNSKNDLQTSFRLAGLELQKRLANLIPPSRVRSRGFG